MSFIKFERAYCFYDLHDPVLSMETHSFGDASNKIYAAVIYLRYEMKSGLIKSALVCSKSKICSINVSVTIPRAELSGVLLMCRFTSSWVVNKDKVYKMIQID